MSEPAPVALEGIHKRFGATIALDDVSLALVPGEVHVLAGQNGAGKSTLIKILSGVHQPDAGTVRLHGERQVLDSPKAAKRAGIATIHQELSLVGAMDVTDNLLLGEEGSAWGLRDRRRRRERTRRLLEAVSLDVDPDIAVEQLPLATQQLVEIARALGSGARVLIMDEPTSALPQHDAERLFERIEDLKSQGCSILYISHRMEELERLADRVTVLRDGRVVACEDAAEMSRDALVRQMIGGDVAASSRRVDLPAEDPGEVLVARGLAASWRGARLLGIDLTLHRGEIVGVAGLQGSGASILPRALFGAVPTTGEIRIADRIVAPSPPRSLDAGVVMISGDRTEGLIGPASVVDNATISSLERFCAVGTWLRRAARDTAAEAALSRMHAAHPGLGAPLSSLSGGNQQKVALARALLAEPRVLLLDEPTRGIDVAAKRDVHEALRELAADGVAIVIVSSDLDELVTLADRALVLVDGSVNRTLAGDALTRSALLAAAIGGDAP
ncbi:MAG TPA: sugar ABC transporter ATP-binding protein [Polyangiaceae bacterium]|nr:sugar ABC transporter ATP-binding protein [Polyangiaceae bacterium]